MLPQILKKPTGCYGFHHDLPVEGYIIFYAEKKRAYCPSAIRPPCHYCPKQRLSVIVLGTVARIVLRAVLAAVLGVVLRVIFAVVLRMILAVVARIILRVVLIVVRIVFHLVVGHGIPPGEIK